MHLPPTTRSPQPPPAAENTEPLVVRLTKHAAGPDRSPPSASPGALPRHTAFQGGARTRWQRAHRAAPVFTRGGFRVIHFHPSAFNFPASYVKRRHKLLGLVAVKLSRAVLLLLNACV